MNEIMKSRADYASDRAGALSTLEKLIGHPILGPAICALFALLLLGLIDPEEALKRLAELFADMQVGLAEQSR